MIEPASLKLRFGPVGCTERSERRHELDGLRGWASLSVVCFHLTWELFGQIQPCYRNPLSAALFDGSLAVAVFFVLSGEALSAAYFSGGGLRVVRKLALRRYTRLTIPILGSCLIVWALVAAKLNFNAVAGSITQRPEWLGAWLRSPITVPHFLRYVLLDVFTNVPVGEAINPFLWTMKIELIGSVLVFAILVILHGRRAGWPILVLILIALLLVDNDLRFLSCFVVGIFLSALRAGGWLNPLLRTRMFQRLSAVAIFGVFVGSAFLFWKGYPAARVMFIAPPLVALATTNNAVVHFLRNSWSQWLGHISFPLYLVQFSVIVSPVSYLIARAGPDITFSESAVIALIGLALSIAAAAAFLPIEWLTKKVGAMLTTSFDRRSRRDAR